MPTIFDTLRAQRQKIPVENTPVEKKTSEPQEETQKQTGSIFDAAKRRKEEKPPILQETPKHPEKIEEKPAEFPFEGENDLDREIERNIARGTSRIIETGLGFPGDIENFARFLVGNENETFLPTSQNLREKAEKLGGGYLTPKSEGEQFTDELIKDITGFSLPGTGKFSFARNLGIPIVSNFLKEGLKSTGTEEKNADYAKVGTMFALDLMANRQGGAKKFASQLFRDSESLVPQGATVSGKNLYDNLSKLKKYLNKGGSSPSITAAVNKIDEIRKKIKKGRGNIDVDELIATRKKINELIESGGGFEFQAPRGLKNKAINNLNDVKKQVIGSLNEYGNVNPEFGKLNKAANEAYGAYSASNVVGNFLKKNFGDKIESGALKALLGISSGVGLKYFPAATGIGAATLPLYQGIKIGYRVWNSPVLRKYYSDIVKNSLAGNVSATFRSIQALDKRLVKEEKKYEDQIKHLKRIASSKK